MFFLLFKNINLFNKPKKYAYNVVNIGRFFTFTTFMYVKMEEKVTRQEDQQENVEGQHTFSSSLNILYILLTPVSFFYEICIQNM